MHPSTQLRTYSVLATLSYFDLFSYPLTAWEAWKWLYTEEQTPRMTFDEVRECLNKLQTEGRVERHEGFFCLPQRSESIPVRKERYLLAEKKFRQVQRSLRILQTVPFVRCVAVCNSLAYSNARPESDLDVFVVSQPGRIWTTRMFAAGIMKMLGRRPTSGHTQDALCLSFFVADASEDLQSLARPPRDLYFRYWIDQLVPVYGDVSAIDELRQANQWYREKLPNAYGTEVGHFRRVRPSRVARFFRRAVETAHSGSLGDRLERMYARRQHRMLPPALKALVNKDARVVMNDRMLKFHENDRLEEFANRFAARLQEVESL